MYRTVRLIVIAAIAEMTLVSLAALAWKGWMLGGLDPAHLHSKIPFLFLFLPVWLAVGWVYAGRRLASERPRVSDSHRKYLNRALAVTALAMAALHGVYAYAFVTGWTPDRQAFVRLLVVFVGGWMAIQGNLAAKLDPPSGDGAPRAAVWTRTVMRMGWVMVLSGIVLIGCGLAAPQLLLLPLMVVLVLIGVGAELAYRRMTRPGQHA